MGAIRKSRCQTGRLNAAECRDAQERRSDGEVEKAMDGFFNNLPGKAREIWHSLQDRRGDLVSIELA